MAVYIPKDQHVFIAGKTGTGKTFLARKYLAGYKYVAAIDTKRRLKWPEVPGTVWDDYRLIDGGSELTLVEHLEDLSDIDTPKVIYRPAWNEMAPDFYNAFFEWCFKRENTTVWVDEVYMVTKGETMPDFYRAILAQGRELGVPVWSLTQRPKQIPQLVMSESTHYFVFDLNMPQDRERIADITGMGEFLQKPGKYKFWYHNVEHDRAILAELVEG